jgi:hypothetical protein
MKTIKFNNKIYQIPWDWQSVTLRQQILSESLSSTQTHVKSLGVIAAYTQIPIDELKQANTKDLLEIMTLLSFIDKELSKESLFQFEYKGESYNVSETIIKQQFQDWIAAQTAIAEYKDNNWKQLVYLLAIMAKKDGETLDNFDVNERAEYFMDVDVETCHRVGAFFLSNQKASEFILMYSSPEVQQEIAQSKIRELKHTLNKLKKQRGGNVLIRLWIGVMNLLIKFYTRQLEKYFNSQVSDNSTKSYNKTWRRLQWMKRKQKTKNK